MTWRQVTLAALLAMPLAAVSSPAQTTLIPGKFEPVRVHVTDKTPVQTLRMDGTWLFKPIAGALTPAALATEARRMTVDADADAAGASTGGWHPLRVPQFLNRYAWWLDISKKFVVADGARLAALPFEAKKTQAGWYRHQIELPPGADPLPEIVVNFEGVAMLSRVYCNGYDVGGHVGMFGEFECRLTPHLKRGSTNTLLVYAERGADVKGADEVIGVAVTVPVTRGMLASLNHGMFGGFGRGAFAKFLGIWQPVTLKVSAPGGRIADAFFKPALHGHTIDVTLQNPGTQAVAGRIHYLVREVRTGTLLCTETVAKPLELAGETVQTLTLEKHGLSPELWSPDYPNLYELVIEWRSSEGNRLVDRWTHRVGYRTLVVQGDRFYLNGKPWWPRGAGMPVYGYKPNDAATAHGFLRTMHTGNQRVTRSGCNPWNHLWFGAADEEGVGVAGEGVRPWALMSKQPPPEPAILAQWKQEQLETVRQYRNHPSILFYCISNEGLQGDYENPAKLAIFKDLIDAVRRADPSRPICQTSGDPDSAGHAEIEDVHSYWGWYESSSFVNEYDKPRRGLTGSPGHAFLNKECAVPYQDTDTGGVHPSYIRRYSAHAWVGELGAEGGDPSFFAEHVRAEAKLKAEKLRFQRREQPSAGVILFANTTWIKDVLTRPPAQWQPFPVWDAIRKAFEPVLVAWSTSQSVFWAGDVLRTRVYVVNDDAGCRDLKDLAVHVEIVDGGGSIREESVHALGNVDYFAVRDWPLELKVPVLAGAAAGMIPASVRFKLLSGSTLITENVYPIRVAARDWAVAGGPRVAVVADGCGEPLRAQLVAMGLHVFSFKEAAATSTKVDVVLLGPEADSLSETAARSVLKPGGRLLVVEQGAAARRFFADLVPADNSNAGVVGKNHTFDDFMFEKAATKPTGTAWVEGEFVEMLGWAKRRPLFDGLAAMDWKWWAQGSGQPAYVCLTSHWVDAKNPAVIPLGRFLQSHFYWSGDLNKVYQSKLSYPVFAVRRPWGELIVCELRLSAAVAHEPRAARTLGNLICRSIGANDSQPPQPPPASREP
jgi:hypothetical protein